ncbi:hypothetical protein EK21DRAFT_114686 [Setomelanomma holmii]|uniref:RING-type domain-containing protein n=1 Tax=Setomelanomma holmii TaxID=210430 RepID=A0A9P4LL33_9PLEO|nr:hypothetical protein EK21DRAFT_114686 [Setomelanomma holmii]
MTHDQAHAYVSSLPTVPVESIDRNDMRFTFCWADHGEPGLEGNVTPVRTPCGHVLMFDCLVQALEGESARSPTCPMCRSDMGTMAEGRDGDESDDEGDEENEE